MTPMKLTRGHYSVHASRAEASVMIPSGLARLAKTGLHFQSLWVRWGLMQVDRGYYNVCIYICIDAVSYV